MIWKIGMGIPSMQPPFIWKRLVSDFARMVITFFSFLFKTAIIKSDIGVVVLLLL
jgi:hypothetical protein